MTVATTRLMDIRLGGHTIRLHVSPELFEPNRVTQLFSNAVEINQGDIVLDLGSGVGPLAIWSAYERSSHVFAVETVREQCELLSRNIAMHDLAEKITVYQGNLFDSLPANLKVNVIISDCSGIAEGPARASGWYPAKIPTGGSDGTEKVLSVLAKAPQILASDGRLYFPILVGFSDHRKVQHVAREVFSSVQLKARKSFPLPPNEKEAILQTLPEEYLKDMTNKGSRLCWTAEIYEAKHPR